MCFITFTSHAAQGDRDCRYLPLFLPFESCSSEGLRKLFTAMELVPGGAGRAGPAVGLWDQSSELMLWSPTTWPEHPPASAVRTWSVSDEARPSLITHGYSHL